jgi:hypothetical protein
MVTHGEYGFQPVVVVETLARYGERQPSLGLSGAEANAPQPCAEAASTRMFAPAQKILGLPLVITTVRTSGCSNRSH